MATQRQRDLARIYLLDQKIQELSYFIEKGRQERVITGSGSLIGNKADLYRLDNLRLERERLHKRATTKILNKNEYEMKLEYKKFSYDSAVSEYNNAENNVKEAYERYSKDKSEEARANLAIANMLLGQARGRVGTAKYYLDKHLSLKIKDFLADEYQNEEQNKLAPEEIKTCKPGRSASSTQLASADSIAGGLCSRLEFLPAIEEKGRPSTNEFKVNNAASLGMFDLDLKTSTKEPPFEY